MQLQLPPQIQSAPTNTVFVKSAGGSLPTPVLVYDNVNFDNELTWFGSTLGTGQTQWALYSSDTQTGGFAEWLTVPSVQFEIGVRDSGLVGFWFLVVGWDSGNNEVTNLSNVVQSAPIIDLNDGIDIAWQWDNTDPSFWITYKIIAGVPTFFNAQTGDSRGYETGGLTGDIFIVGNSNALGTGTQQTPRSNVGNG